MEAINQFADSLALPTIVVVFGIAIASHLVARIVGWMGISASQRLSGRSLAKARTVVRLTTGTAVFGIYFLATGAILAEFGISLTAYLATASVIGLAIGFGSQSVVQDLVVGVTVILSDLVDVGEMVEISGQVGIVKNVGMRFTVLQNAMGATVYIPNRTLTSLINYPRGYIRCLMDVTLPDDDAEAAELNQQLSILTEAFAEQFPGVLRAPIEIEPQRQTVAGKRFTRIKFRIWPNRGGPIEGPFRQEVIVAAQAIEEGFKDSRVIVNYEVEAQPIRT